MLIRLKDLETLRVVSRDGGHHAVLDPFASGQAPRVTHVVGRLESWFEGRQCVMRVGTFDAPDLDRGEWPVTADRAEVEAAPGAGVDGSGDGAAVLVAAKGEEAGSAMLSRAGCSRTVPVGEDVRSASAPLGAPPRARDRQVGTTTNAIVETDDWSVAMPVMRAGAQAASIGAWRPPAWWSGSTGKRSPSPSAAARPPWTTAPTCARSAARCTAAGTTGSRPVAGWAEVFSPEGGGGGPSGAGLQKGNPSAEPRAMAGGRVERAARGGEGDATSTPVARCGPARAVGASPRAPVPSRPAR